MLRSHVVTIFFLSFLAICSSMVVPVQRRQLSSISVESFDPNTVTHLATEMDIPAATETSISITSATSRTVTATPTPTQVINDDDSGEYIPPPPPPDSYYENEGADGSSTGFINVSVGAQAGIIVAIVLVGLGVMGGCIWFWTKKQKEWKAALERRRTLRASRIAAAKAAKPEATKKKKGEDRKGDEKKPTELTQMKKGNSNSSSSTVVSTEVTAVDVERSQFDVMTPTESESPSWWKKVLPKKK